MFRIDAPDNVNNRFSEGNPQTGQPGTVVSADWLNAVQEELVAFITGMGLSLDKSNNGQLFAALLAFLARPSTWTARQTFDGGCTVPAPVNPTDAATMGWVLGRGIGIKGYGSIYVRSDLSIELSPGSVGMTSVDRSGNDIRFVLPGGGSGNIIPVPTGQFNLHGFTIRQTSWGDTNGVQKFDLSGIVTAWAGGDQFTFLVF